MSEFKSKLQARQGITGIGSGIPRNQEVLGVKNPEMAAKMAALSSTDLNREESKFAEIYRKRDLLISAMAEGFSPSIDPSWAADNDIESFNKVYAEFESWQTAEIDKDTDDALIGSSADDPLYDPMLDSDRKKRIEKDLKPLDFEQMVFQGYCEQEVAIRGTFKVVFRTMSTRHSLWIESMLLDLKDRSVQYGRHWMGLVQLAVSLQSINGKPIGPSLASYIRPDQEEDFKKALMHRTDYLGELPQMLTDDLIVQVTWFMGRVRKMMTGDLVGKVGN